VNSFEEAILVGIVLFFSGVWSAIRFVDEFTDNRWVFFVPAGVMSLFLLSGFGNELYWFCGFLFVFGPIIVMLIFVGLHQEGQNSSFSIRTRGTPGKKDLHRKLAPSYKRAYDRLIGYVQARGGEINSRDDGIRRLNELGVVDAERFFSSPYVIKTLDLPSESTSQPSSHVSGGGASNGVGRTESVVFSEIEGDDWWEKGYEAGEDKSSQKTDPDGDSCGNPQCSNSVSAFDFRCFTCRKRFCSEHAGAKIECNDCSQ
jgi:hypothetical protein